MSVVDVARTARKVGGLIAAGACATPAVLRLVEPRYVGEELIELTMAIAFVGLMVVLVRGRRGVLGAFWPALGAAFVGVLLPAWLLGWALVPAPGIYQARDAPPGRDWLVVYADRLEFGGRPRADVCALHALWDGTPGCHFLDYRGDDSTACMDDCGPSFTVSRPWPLARSVKLLDWRDAGRVVTYEPASP